MNFFDWCVCLSNLTSYKAKKSICYFLISVLSCTDAEVILTLLSSDSLTNFIFDFLNVAKSKLLTESFHCFLQMMTIIPDFNNTFPQLIPELFSLIERAETVECEEIIPLSESLKKILESALDI